jgi:dTDP-4-amino-4,6-dideoxygalactose transaminase
VFADVEADTFALTPESVAEVVTPATRAVIVVHIGGRISPRLPELRAYCDSVGLPLIEDAAHAHGCSLDGRGAGSFGTIGAFSFYPTKVITSGEGGMLVTADADLAAEARVYRDQGKEGFLVNAHTRDGYSWRMSELHAATGVVSLRRLPEFLAHRKRVAEKFDAALADAAVLRPLPPVPGLVDNHYKYVVLLPPGTDRGAVKRRARAAGVSLSGEVYETPLHRQPVFAEIPHGPLPVSEDICARHICLPVLSDMTPAEVDQVLETILEIDDELSDNRALAS